MDLLNRFLAHVNSRHLFTKSDRLLLAVSGGVDSVVLGALCKMAGFDFGVAHCNFQLRGADSDGDEQFVKELAAKWEVPFYSIRFNTLTFAAENKLSIQEAARELRYGWFEDVRKLNGFDYTVTAHHANDNLETVLMNFFRGTGINGLTGIKEKKDAIVRPLLFARRNDLELFLKVMNLSFVQDASNLTNDYTRNFLRNELLPQLATIYPEVENNLIGNTQRFKEVKLLYGKAVEQYKKKLAEQKGAELYVAVLLLLRSVAPSTLLFEIIKDYGFSASQVAEVLRLTESESGHYVASSTHRIIRDRKHLIIAPLRSTENARAVIEGAGNYLFPGGRVIVQSRASDHSKIPETAAVAWLDAKLIEFPLVLRPGKTGDYFYPLGMEKKKKLSRFLIDKKLSLTEKEKVWVVEMNKKIIWVVGYRIDNRFKVTEKTTDIIELKWETLEM